MEVFVGIGTQQRAVRLYRGQVPSPGTPRGVEGCVGIGTQQPAVRLYRGQIPSPGRPAVAWREDRVRFWAAIARGLSSEDAAAETGVSPAVGTRWFRHAGGVGPNLPPTASG